MAHGLAPQNRSPDESDQLHETSDQQQEVESDVDTVAPLLT